MIGMTEIKKVQSETDFANLDIEKAEDLLLDVIEFLCCNKFMRILRFLFKKKFDKQYDKLSKAYDRLVSAKDFLEDQWYLLEHYWNEEAMNN